MRQLPYPTYQPPAWYMQQQQQRPSGQQAMPGASPLGVGAGIFGQYKLGQELMAQLSKDTAASATTSGIPFAGGTQLADTALSTPAQFGGATTSATGFNIAGEVPTGLTYDGGMTGMGGAPTGLGSTGALSTGLGAVGTAYGGYQALQGIKKKNPLQAGMGGVGAGLGLNAMGLALGPMGWAAIAGAPVAAALANKVLDKKSTKQIQSDRWKAVGMEDRGPRDFFAGTGGEKSRDESFLTADAIRENPDNYRAAEDFGRWSRAQQDKFLNTLLKEKAVDERQGGIYLNDERAKQLADQIRAEGPGQTAPLRSLRSRTLSPGISKTGQRISYKIPGSGR